MQVNSSWGEEEGIANFPFPYQFPPHPECHFQPSLHSLPVEFPPPFTPNFSPSPTRDKDKASDSEQIMSEFGQAQLRFQDICSTIPKDLNMDQYDLTSYCPLTTDYYSKIIFVLYVVDHQRCLTQGILIA